MNSGFVRLLDPGCDLDKYASDEDKVLAIITSIQISLFKSMFVAEILSKALKDAGAKGGYGGRDVYEVLEDVRAKTSEALHVLADEREIADMYRMYAGKEEDDA